MEALEGALSTDRESIVEFGNGERFRVPHDPHPLSLMVDDERFRVPTEKPLTLRRRRRSDRCGRWSLRRRAPDPPDDVHPDTTVLALFDPLGTRRWGTQGVVAKWGTGWGKSVEITRSIFYRDRHADLFSIFTHFPGMIRRRL